MAIHSTMMGNLGRDPELINTRSGTPLLKFALATRDGWGERERTMWVSVAVFGKRGEGLAKVLRKGDRVVVSGTLTLDEYKDRDGNDKQALALNASQVELAGGGEGRQESRGGGGRDNGRGDDRGRGGYGNDRGGRGGYDDERGGSGGRDNDRGGGYDSRREPPPNDDIPF